MRSVLNWREGMCFDVQAGSHRLYVDAKEPIGADTAPTPKDLLLVALGGCTAIDVVALLRKMRQPFEGLEVEVEAKPSEGPPPMVFRHCSITFKVSGRVDPDKVLEAVRLSQTKLCGVSSMLAKAFPIEYFVELNGERIGSGHAHFLEIA